MEENNCIKYSSIGEYETDSPVSSFIYNLRNALCHDGIGFLPINSSVGKNEITDVIFKTNTERGDIRFMAVLKVAELEEFLEKLSKLYIKVENGRRGANEKAYREFFEGIQKDRDNFFKK